MESAKKSQNNPKQATLAQMSCNDPKTSQNNPTKPLNNPN